jgi:hypothetical protein
MIACGPFFLAEKTFHEEKFGRPVFGGKALIDLLP